MHFYLSFLFEFHIEEKKVKFYTSKALWTIMICLHIRFVESLFSKWTHFTCTYDRVCPGTKIQKQFTIPILGVSWSCVFFPSLHQFGMRTSQSLGQALYYAPHFLSIYLKSSLFFLNIKLHILRLFSVVSFDYPLL